VATQCCSMTNVETPAPCDIGEFKPTWLRRRKQITIQGHQYFIFAYSNVVQWWSGLRLQFVALMFHPMWEMIVRIKHEPCPDLNFFLSFSLLLLPTSSIYFPSCVDYISLKSHPEPSGQNGIIDADFDLSIRTEKKSWNKLERHNYHWPYICICQTWLSSGVVCICGLYPVSDYAEDASSNQAWALNFEIPPFFFLFHFKFFLLVPSSTYFLSCANSTIELFSGKSPRS
jgi:hypothetical protein